jgi:ketosteroid isomerase-like protein
MRQAVDNRHGHRVNAVMSCSGAPRDRRCAREMRRREHLAASVLCAPVDGRDRQVSDTAAMSAENVEIVRRLNQTGPGGDVAAALELLDPEIEIEYRGILIDRDATYHGHAGALQLWEAILETFPDFRMEAQEYIDHGEDVVVAVHQWAAGKASRRTGRRPYRPCLYSAQRQGDPLAYL